MSTTPLLGTPRAPSTWLISAGETFLRGARELVALIARELRVRRDMRRLSELDDTMLRDIGIARSDIEGAVRRGHDPR